MNEPLEKDFLHFLISRNLFVFLSTLLCLSLRTGVLHSINVEIMIILFSRIPWMFSNFFANNNSSSVFIRPQLLKTIKWQLALKHNMQTYDQKFQHLNFWLKTINNYFLYGFVPNDYNWNSVCGRIRCFNFYGQSSTISYQIFIKWVDCIL